MNAVPVGTSIPITDRYARLKPVDGRVPFVLIPRHEVPAEVAEDPNVRVVVMRGADKLVR